MLNGKTHYFDWAIFQFAMLVIQTKYQTDPVERDFYRHWRAHRCGLSTTDETRRCPPLQSNGTVVERFRQLRGSDVWMVGGEPPLVPSGKQARFTMENHHLYY